MKISLSAICHSSMKTLEHTAIAALNSGCNKLMRMLVNRWSWKRLLRSCASCNEQLFWFVIVVYERFDQRTSVKCKETVGICIYHIVHMILVQHFWHMRCVALNFFFGQSWFVGVHETDGICCNHTFWLEQRKNRKCFLFVHPEVT